MDQALSCRSNTKRKLGLYVGCGWRSCRQLFTSSRVTKSESPTSSTIFLPPPSRVLQGLLQPPVVRMWIQAHQFMNETMFNGVTHIVSIFFVFCNVWLCCRLLLINSKTLCSVHLLLRKPSSSLLVMRLTAFYERPIFLAWWMGKGPSASLHIATHSFCPTKEANMWRADFIC